MRHLPVRLIVTCCAVLFVARQAYPQAAAPATKPAPTRRDAPAMGFKVPPRNEMQRSIQTQDVKARGVAAAAAAAGSPLARPAAGPEVIEKVPSAFDWSDPQRPGGSKVTSVQDQGNCGSCYDFTANAALEASYAIRQQAAPTGIGSSEQCLLDCQGSYGCDGGWWDQPFNLMIARGLPSRADYPYTAVKSACKLDGANPPQIQYRAANWGYVDRDNVTFIPTDEAMKRAILEHGPIAVALFASQPFVDYGWDHHGPNDVFIEKTTEEINHAVLIVGWDDNKVGSGQGAWKIKNSWGTEWGADGFLWVGYGVNKIGFNAAWVDATSAKDELFANATYLKAAGLPPTPSAPQTP